MTDQTADQLFFEADELIREKKFAEAEQALLQATEKDPKHGRSYNHLGWLSETKYRDYARAEGYYKKALEHTPEYPAIYLNYAVVLSQLQRYEDLKDLLKKAEAVPGINKDRIYNEYGLLYEDKAEFDTAIDWYKKAALAAKSKPDIDAYRANIARCEEKKSI